MSSRRPVRASVLAKAIPLLASSATLIAPVAAEPFAFVTNQHDNSMSVIDTARLGVIAQPDVGEFPEGVIVGPTGKRVYVVSWFSNELLVMDAGTLELIGRIPTGESPRAFGVFLPGGS
jgi:YVTN family beta-propeller protein